MKKRVLGIVGAMVGVALLGAGVDVLAASEGAVVVSSGAANGEMALAVSGVMLMVVTAVGVKRAWSKG